MNVSKLKKYISEKISDVVKKELKISLDNKDITLEFPPDVKFGDFAFSCFVLAKELGKNPAEIANQIAENFPQSDIIEKAQAVGPYVNFKIANQTLFQAVCADAGITKKSKQGKAMVEYLSPNTNKPLHLGHLRNGALGMAVANMLEVAGYEVIKANLINDRGAHICKSMLAYQKWGNNETPATTGEKGDHFVGKYYIKYAVEAEKDPNLKERIEEMLRKWEAGDKKTIALWKKMNSWVYGGFEQTYKDFGLEFDKFYYESQTYKLGKEIVLRGLQHNSFINVQSENKAIVAILPTEEFGLDQNDQPKKATLIRDDGTSVYLTQDLGTAVMKFEEFGLDKSIYVVGSEQEHHFKVLFKLLEMLGYEWAKNCFHLSYGMVYLPEGKMKSREGKIVDADDLIKEMIGLAKEEIKKRDLENKLSEKKIQERAAKIGVGAIKFYLLSVNPKKDIHFDPVASISFDGCTGPYCQYTYARAKSILAKSENAVGGKIDFSVLGTNEELTLVKHLIQMPDEITVAVEEMNPARLVVYVHSLAMAFNQFYQTTPVLKTDDPSLTKARLVLVKATASAIEKLLNLLNIETLEQM